MQTTQEWQIVEHLMTRINLMEEYEMKFITNMFDNLDPYQPFLGQCTEKQLKWLHSLFMQYKKNLVKS